MEIGVLDPFLRGWGCCARLIGVSRSHYRGINEFVNPVGKGDQLSVLEFRFDLIPRQDVGYIHLKDVRSLLFQEGCALAFLLCLLVRRTGLFTLLDLCRDGAISDGHLHAVDSSPC